MLSCLLVAFYLCNPNAPAYAYAQPQVVYAQPQMYAQPQYAQQVYAQPVVVQQPVYYAPPPAIVIAPRWGGGGWGYGRGYYRH